MKKVSVILPTYNERENIIEVTERISKTLGKDLYEIVVVDDNSPDGTWKIVQEMNNSRYKLIKRIEEKGLASALARGVDETKGDIVVWLDCDLGIEPEYIPLLVNKLNNFDVVIGSRYVTGGQDLRPKMRVFYSILINKFAGFLLGSKIKDYTSGFIAIKKNVLEKVKINPHGFGEYFIDFAYRCAKNKLKITEVGYIYKNRTRGTSKSDGSQLILFKLGFQYTKKIISLYLENLFKKKSVKKF